MMGVTLEFLISGLKEPIRPQVPRPRRVLNLSPLLRLQNPYPAAVRPPLRACPLLRPPNLYPHRQAQSLYQVPHRQKVYPHPVPQARKVCPRPRLLKVCQALVVRSLYLHPVRHLLKVSVLHQVPNRYQVVVRQARNPYRHRRVLSPSPAAVRQAQSQQFILNYHQ